MKEYLDLFNLDENFNLDDLKKAYKKKVLEYNPNLAKDDLEKEEFKKITKKLNFANKELKKHLQNDEINDVAKEDNDITKEPDLIQKQAPTPKKSKDITKTIISSIICLSILFIIDIINTPDETISQTPKEEIKKENIEEPRKATREEIQSIEIYMQALQARIKSNWQLPENLITDTVIKVSFTISRDGRLIGEPRIIKSSGNKRTDDLCITAIISSMPYKPLPKGIDRDSIDVEFTFEAIRKN